ncbi:MAG TPA: SRPBCC domain-containing protein [Acidimicrobiales bacterium]|jgi:uncharacterized protein YndB with AHSA1/START domain|nr:SRPBCC domain-containing protein [Acidimicrobiales bacterium]
MTTATDRTASQDTSAGSDFESTRTFAASAADVLAALRTTEAISSWWAPATGSADPGGTLDLASRSGSRLLELDVERAGHGRVAWSVRLSTMTPEWVGTTIAFEVEEADGGATLHFRHHGLTPQCDCFDMCDAGWTSALDRLESFVATGDVAYARDSFQSTKSISASPAAVLAALRTPEAVADWWGPSEGSADVGGTLVVSFQEGQQRIVMDVQPAPAGRVIWAVREAPLTPDWDGTTIYFDVAEAGDGAMLYFRHEGLTPELECYDMCFEGWTHYVASLVSYVETGQGQPHRHG